MALELGTLIRIDTRITASGVARTTFGMGLLVTRDAALSAGGRGKVRQLNSLAEAEALFAADSAALAAARVWFAADPPAKSLYIGRWADVDVDTTLTGGDPGTVDALKQANASFRLDGNDVTVNLGAANTYAALAAAIQVALRNVAGFGAATFTYTNNVFVLTLDGAGAIEGGALAPHSAGTGTDISGLLGMTQATGVDYKQGHDAESLGAAVVEMRDLAVSGAPVALMLAADVPDAVGAVNVRRALAAVAQGGDYVAAILETNAQALATNDATSEAAVAFAASQDKVAAIYSMAGQKPDVGLMALMSAQNLDSRNSIITPNAKVLPSVLPTDITSAQLAELERKRTNVYTTVEGEASLLEGYTSRGGYWLDAVWWVLWAKRSLQLAIWRSQRSSERFNRVLLLDALTRVMQRGVGNGGLKPGRKLSADNRISVIATTGNDAFDGVLTTGFLVWVSPSPPDADREGRIGRFKIWATGADAIHKVFGDLTFAN